jgi:tripartite-type tricarboxylate transporter receptor subunit TctC
MKASKLVVALATTVATLAAPALFAAEALKVIIPTAPGGGTDGYFRVLAKEVEPVLNEPVVVMNVPGAGGTIGVSQMVRSTPDGQTVAAVWLGPVTVSTHTMKVTYTPADYIPVIQVSSAPYVLCVHPEFPAADGAGLIAELKKNPDKYTYGNDGLGGPGQLATARILRAMNASARDVPFKGAGETLTAFLGKHVDIYVGSIPPILQHVQGGKAKCLLVTSADRVAALPSAASLRDLGFRTRRRFSGARCSRRRARLPTAWPSSRRRSRRRPTARRRRNSSRTRASRWRSRKALRCAATSTTSTRRWGSSRRRSTSRRNNRRCRTAIRVPLLSTRATHSACRRPGYVFFAAS